MNLTRTRERGNFYCPGCRVPQTHRLRARRPWLTLYFIPTIPIGNAEVFVQCDQCKQTWDPTVLDMDQETHEAAEAVKFLDEALRAAILVTLVDGTISEPEIQSLIEIASYMQDRDVDRDEIGHLCSIAQQNKIEAVNYVLTVSIRWNQKQKRQALQAMFLAATAEGEMTDKKVKTLAKMQELLGMTDAEYQDAIEAALG
ncbi:tellurite resistance TerB family protein [Rubripirellula reticaptiva]|nr:TerB family tellurite resistance protein [Rubripirellula reticaptiva]